MPYNVEYPTILTTEVTALEENTGLGIRLRKLNNAIRRYLDHNSVIMRELDNLTCSNKWIMGYLFDAEEEGRDVFQRDLEQNFGITRWRKRSLSDVKAFPMTRGSRSLSSRKSPAKSAGKCAARAMRWTKGSEAAFRQRKSRLCAALSNECRTT